MSTQVVVRAERVGDQAPIREVVAAAFTKEPEVPGLVDALRESAAFIPAFSLVATVADEVVGHVLLTVAELLDDDEALHRVLVLSPLSVQPAHQRRGIGGALVTETLARADTAGEGMVVLQGSPRYYPRFGFRPASELGVSMELPDWAPPEAAMACPLSAYRPSTRGRLIESQPFLDLAH